MSVTKDNQGWFVYSLMSGKRLSPYFTDESQANAWMMKR